MLTFVYPTEANREDVLSFYAEFEAEGTACIGCAGYQDYDKWLTGIHNRITCRRASCRKRSTSATTETRWWASST